MILLVLIALIPAGGVWFFIQDWPPIWRGISVVAIFAITYLILAHQNKTPGMDAWIGRLKS